ncbi:MAG: tRNA (adenosine(37)-N6)-threonylcarbamoyltransferase complex transferase subunit TsaD [bacterium]|nr:tRNA (adenosine(37)-N6)-threonylcarbamoyltransferase complex transferase subunit TsaD [bacterium]MDD5757245.1 tRNA (adenosine(37)-N6)-threonylcarbamoyltransferase complex transferase subunit TsaD [bacterium]
MNILAIETSCDDTSAGVIQNGRSILSNVISSQIEIHSKYGGVVPELASRHHLENINFVIAAALKKAHLRMTDIDALAVTQGPGLVGSLLAGIMAAKTLALIYRLPLLPVNHIEGHIYANFIEHQLKPPFLALVISGGHTELIIQRDLAHYRILGRTRDDAVGEAYDKVAKLLDLGYPGGPVIDRLAKQGDPYFVKFPRPYLPGTYDFSFSGLKTAVVNYVSKLPSAVRHPRTKDIVASFQQSVIEVLVNKTIQTAQKLKMKKIVLAGGVAANSALRSLFAAKIEKTGIKLYYPSPILCTDNAAMIGCAAYYRFRKKKLKYHQKMLTFKAEPNLQL